jgi:protein-S-isoprenylcysteine O-methyltransferase Ste14
VTSSRTLFVALRGVLYATGFILFWGWLAFGASRRYDDRLGLELPAWATPIGILLMVPGGLVALACIATFIVRGQGTPAPFDPPVVFVPTGPYRYVRNPMYVGAGIFLAGLALFQRSVSILAFSAVLLFAAHFFVLFVEEPSLERRFGQTYLAYKRATNRWLPRFRSRAGAGSRPT